MALYFNNYIEGFSKKTHSAFTFSKLTIETLGVKDVKYVQS